MKTKSKKIERLPQSPHDEHFREKLKRPGVEVLIQPSNDGGVIVTHRLSVQVTQLVSKDLGPNAMAIGLQKAIADGYASLDQAVFGEAQHALDQFGCVFDSMGAGRGHYFDSIRAALTLSRLTTPLLATKEVSL